MTLGKANDKFPEFDLADLIRGDTDDDVSLQSNSSKYQTKEDEDVAVFMKIAERLNFEQLTHLLQGRSHSELNLPPFPPARSPVSKTSSTNSTSTSTAPGTPILKRVKKFRFALIAGDKHVRSVVHEIQSNKRMHHLWWSDEEMLQIRRQAIDTVRHFRNHRPSFIQAVETVASSNDHALVEASMKQLTRDSFARGLETHIVSFLSQARTETVKAVLEEQRECRMCNDSYEVTCASLRGQSLAYSQASNTFATRMAGCDQVEALKATLSQWEPGQEDTEHPVDEEESLLPSNSTSADRNGRNTIKAVT